MGYKFETDASQTIQYSKSELISIGESIPDAFLPIFCIEQKNAWQVGDFCMAKFSEDGLYYFAKILSISDDCSTCEVLYTQYNAKEVVQLNDLLTDYGIKKSDMKRIEEPDQKRVLKNENVHPNSFASEPNMADGALETSTINFRT